MPEKKYFTLFLYSLKSILQHLDLRWGDIESWNSLYLFVQSSGLMKIAICIVVSTTVIIRGLYESLPTWSQYLYYRSKCFEKSCFSTVIFVVFEIQKPSPETKHISMFILDFLAPRAVRKKYVLCKPPGLWYFVWLAKQVMMTS